MKGDKNHEQTASGIRLARAAFLALVFLGGLAGTVPASADSMSDCSSISRSFGWNAPNAIDYYDSWEDSLPIGADSPSSIKTGGGSMTCTVAGHSLGCPPSGTGSCIKFWVYFYRVSGDSTLESVGCGTTFASTPGQGSTTLSTRTTPIPDGVLCEAYCPSFISQCSVGDVVTVTMTAVLTYDWEAGEGLTPGQGDTESFHTDVRGASAPTHVQAVCQQGAPLLSLTNPC